MRRFVLILALILCSSAYSQIGIKAGLTYNGNNGLYKSVTTTYSNKGKGHSGYHIGLYKKFNLSGLYIQPELIYVNFKNEFENETGRNLDLKYKRIDLPLSLGSNIFKVINVQAGPVFSYYFKDDINLDNALSVKQKDITLGLQVGAGISLSNLDLSLRYDFPLGSRESKWIENSNYEFITENTPRLLHISLGYNF